MSIFADWALRVSFTRMGSASALISWSRPLLFGYSTTWTAVTFPPATVSSTWTGPQRVCATLPVTVVVADELALEEDGAAADEDVPLVPLDEVPAVLPATGASAEALPPAVAAALDEVDVW